MYATRYDKTQLNISLCTYEHQQRLLTTGSPLILNRIIELTRKIDGNFMRMTDRTIMSKYLNKKLCLAQIVWKTELHSHMVTPADDEGPDGAIVRAAIRDVPMIYFTTSTQWRIMPSRQKEQKVLTLELIKTAPAQVVDEFCEGLLDAQPPVDEEVCLAMVKRCPQIFHQLWAKTSRSCATFNVCLAAAEASLSVAINNNFLLALDQDEREEFILRLADYIREKRRVE